MCHKKCSSCGEIFATYGFCPWSADGHVPCCAYYTDLCDTCLDSIADEYFPTRLSAKL